MQNTISSKHPLKNGLALTAALGALSVTYSAMSMDLPGQGRTVQPVGIPLDEERFQYQVIMLGLEALGYDVEEVSQVQTPIAYLSIASGDKDFSAGAWFPQHTSFYERVGGDAEMSRIGPFSEKALQGYLIDRRTMEQYGIDSIEQLRDPDIAKLFDISGNGKADLTGCEPGWGCEQIIESHLDTYGLRETVQHNQGSYFALMADTISRYNEGIPILYYTWTPLWVSGVLVPGEDVEWLTVPSDTLPEDADDASTALPDGRDLGFPVNDQYIVANKNFIEANPAARIFFENVSIPVEDIIDQNLKIQNGESSTTDILRHAEEWIDTNQEAFDRWINQAKQAED